MWHQVRRPTLHKGVLLGDTRTAYAVTSLLSNKLVKGGGCLHMGLYSKVTVFLSAL